MSKFDGQDIDVYVGRFTGGFDIDEVDGQKINHDDIVTFMVTALVKKSAVDTDKDNQLRRTNTFSVMSAIPMSQDQLNKAAVTAILGSTAGSLLDGMDDPDEGSTMSEPTFGFDDYARDDEDGF